MIKSYLTIIYSFALLLLVFMQSLKIRKIKEEAEIMQKLKRDIYLLCEDVSRVETKEEVYSLILDAAIRLIDRADRGSLLIIEEDGNFHYKALRGYSDELYKVNLKREEVYLYKCNKFKDTAIIMEPLKFDEHTINPNKTNIFRALGALDIYCTISSPIYVDEKLIGVMNIDTSSKERVFNQEDIRLINHIKYELQLALKNFFVQEQLKYMATHDELTKLYNRRSFKSMFHDELNKAYREKSATVLALIDLDDFKNINDTYGHNIGDKALITFTECLLNSVSENDICARMSGDEFVIIFYHCTEEQAREKLLNLRKELDKKKVGAQAISFSYGLCNIDFDEDLTMDDMLSIADRNMYKDKNNKYCRTSYPGA